jgi:type III secretion protein C
MPTMRHAFRALALAVAVAAAWPAAAAERLPAKPCVYTAQQIPLTDLLRDFAGAAGLPIVIAEGISGVVNAKFSTTPRAFLDLISRSFGLIWYYDGTAVHVYPSNQIQSRLFKLNGPLAVNAESRLNAFGFLDERYPLRFVSSEVGTLAFASGPPRHIELIEALVELLGSVDDEPSPERTRAFPLLHASAVDRVVQGVTVPGVATTLTNFFGQRESAAATRNAATDVISGIAAGPTSLVAGIEGSPESRARRDAAMQGIVGSLAKGGSTQPVAPNRPAGAALVAATPVPAKRKPAPATFVADEATNLVMVRATEEQMGAIEALIAQLDTPRDMIEVEATIIDISSDEVQALGFDWRFDGGGAVRQLQISPATATSTSSGAIPQGSGFNITTLLASGGSQLLARIRALEARGTARVVSQPKVLGAANRTAVLSDKRTASVRVAGNQDAQLFSVETGTTLQVTPRLIRDPQQTRISLDLVIEDGGFSTQAVDDVPIAQRTSISTIATLNEGQALLVGGIEIEGTSGGRSGVPLLSKIPVIGEAFRFDSSQSSRRQRLFLITPKRVQLDLVDTAAP